jgi:hypothetical protein
MIEKYGDMYLAGQTLKFVAADNKNQYLKNLKTNRKKLQEGNWVDCELEYKYNHYGFRSEEFDSNIKPRPILFFGCSHTVGIGLHVKQTFPYIISQRLNLHYYNLGVAGGANNTIFRLAHTWIPRLCPSKVVTLYTYNERTEFALGEDNKIKKYIPNYPDTLPGKRYNDWYESWATHPHNGKIQRVMVSNALQNICKKQDVELFEFDIDEQLFRDTIIDYARDLVHFGPKTHTIWADIMLKEILNK